MNSSYYLSALKTWGLAFCLLSLALFGCQSNNSEQQPPETEAITSPQEQAPLHLPHQPNFRDLGVYEGSMGTMKPGILYRSGLLAKLDSQEVQVLDSLGIKTVVSFLTPEEIEAAGEDRLPEGVNRVYLPISGDGDLAQKILLARQEADFSGLPPEINADIHRTLIYHGAEAYQALFRLLADENNLPLVYHCSHGIHRTGTASALIMTALGVPWSEVEKDYLLSNERRAEEIEHRLAYFRQTIAERDGIDEDSVDMRNFEAFYRLQPSYILATQTEVMEEFQDFETYFTDKLDITQADIEAVRNNLLD